MPRDFRTVYDWSGGSSWIADGAQRLARIQPPRLCDLVLRPGGPPLVTWLTLFWWQYSNNEQPGRSAWLVDELQLDDRDPDCYRLFLRTHNEGRSVESCCRLEITYDPALDSYVYGVDTDFRVLPGSSWLVAPQAGVEFADPWLKDAVGAAVPFDGSRASRWAWVLYTDPHGKIVRLPLNHLGASPLGNIFFPPAGGWLAFANHPDGNPVFELDPDTARAGRAEVCAWGYDVHFIRQVSPGALRPSDSLTGHVVLEEGASFRAAYRLYSQQATRCAEWLAGSVLPVLTPEEREALARPAVRLPLNTFQDGIFPLEIDASWYWSPSDADGLSWERDHGRTDRNSLRIENAGERTAYWETPLGPDFWMAPLPALPQRLSGWIRTDAVQGEGAFLELRYSSYAIETGQRTPFPAYRSESVSGSQGWVRLELTAGAPPAGATRAYIRLVLSGTGNAWFDDVELQPLG